MSSDKLIYRAEIILTFAMDTPLAEIEKMHKELKDSLKKYEYIKDIKFQFDKTFVGGPQ